MIERLEMPSEAFEVVDAPKTSPNAKVAALAVAHDPNAKPAASVVEDAPNAKAVEALASETGASLRTFLDGLGLGSLVGKFEEAMIDMPTLMSLSVEQLKEDLMETGVPVGARRKIAQALDEHAKAAKKAAALKEAEDQMAAAAAKQQRDEARIETQRREIEQLRDVIAKRGKPPEAVCPMSLDLMIDPVLAADGHTYERHILEKWLEEHDTSPLTNEVLAHKNLTPVQAVRALVQRFIEECRAAGTDPDAMD